MQDNILPVRTSTRRMISIGLVIAGTLGLLGFLAGHSTGGIPDNRELGWLNQLAQSGDAGAQLQLGLAYREGRYGLTPDAQLSRHWLSESARGGNAYAAEQVASSLTASGKQDAQEQAVQWWQLGARGGNADAEVHLAEFEIHKGQDRQAINWLRKAADLGDTRAHKDLLKLYKHCNLSENDLERGDNPVAVLGERVGSTSLKALFTAWQIIKESSTSEQSGKALKARAHKGDPIAEYQLGERYETGAWDVERDPQKALQWIRRSAESGNRIAAKTLAGFQHDREHGVSLNVRTLNRDDRT